MLPTLNKSIIMIIILVAACYVILLCKIERTRKYFLVLSILQKNRGAKRDIARASLAGWPVSSV